MTASTRPLESTSTAARAPGRSIPGSLAALVAACLVPAMIAVAVMAYVDYRAQEAALLSAAVTQARAMMALVDRDLEGVESGLRVLATANVVTDGDFGRLYDRLRGAQKSQPINNYYLIDPEGRQRLNTLLPFGPPQPGSDLATHLKAVFTTGKPATSGIFPAPSDRTPIVAMGVPVFRGETVAYVLAVAMTPEQIFAAARRSMPDGWVAAVIDSDGRIVARSRDAERYVGQNATPSLLAAVAGRAEGTAETLTKDGAPVLTAFSRSSRSDWLVAVGAPPTLLVASLRRSIALLAAGALLAFGFVLWFALRVSRAVTQAVGGLIEPAVALGNGRPVELAPTPFREIDAVGQAIRQASLRLAAAQHHAYHDPLTDLRNRTLFDEMAQRQIAQSYRDGAQLAILAIDLDGFKAVNDQHGHAAGDFVLKTVADRIMGLVRSSDVVSRRGGDEFAVMLVDVDGVKTRQIAEKLLDALSQPYPGVEPSVSASIGVARYPHEATTLHDLLERADEALYAAKDAGKRRVTGDF